MIDDHAQKTAGGEQGIYFTKTLLGDSLADEVRHDVIIFSHIGAKETVGQAMIFKSAEEQETGKSLVLGPSLQNLGRQPAEYFKVVSGELQVAA